MLTAHETYLFVCIELKVDSLSQGPHWCIVNLKLFVEQNIAKVAQEHIFIEHNQCNNFLNQKRFFNFFLFEITDLAFDFLYEIS